MLYLHSFAAYAVGDFIQEEIKEKVQGKMKIKLEIFRIIAAYQACKSFIGRWVQEDEQIQKRGKSIYFQYDANCTIRESSCNSKHLYFIIFFTSLPLQQGIRI